LPLAFVDEDHSRSSRELARALDATRSTSLAAAPSDLPAAWSLLRAGRAYAVLHVPRDWERRVTRGETQPVVLYTNEQFHAAGTSIANDVTGALLAVAGEHAFAWASTSAGGGVDAAEHHSAPVRAEYRSLYGPQLSFERALGGTLLPATLHLFVLGAAAYALGREFRDRTADKWLESAG